MSNENKNKQVKPVVINKETKESTRTFSQKSANGESRKPVMSTPIPTPAKPSKKQD